MKAKFRIFFIFPCCGFVLAVVLWAVWDARADRRLSDHPAFRAAMAGDGPSASLARFAARPDGAAAEEDPDNAATWMARLPSYEDTVALLSDALGIEPMRDLDWGWPIHPDMQNGFIYNEQVRYMEQVINNPNVLTAEQRQRFFRLFETHRDLADTLEKMGDCSYFNVTIHEQYDSIYHGLRSLDVLALTQKALFAASAVLGLEGESDRAAELWMIAVRATDQCLTVYDALSYHYRRNDILWDAFVASTWIFADPELDRAAVYAAMEMMRTDQMIAQMRQVIEMDIDQTIAYAVVILRKMRKGEMEYDCDCAKCRFPICWQRALLWMAPIVVSPLLKEDLSLRVDHYDTFLQMLEAPPWEWDLDGWSVETGGKEDSIIWRYLSQFSYPFAPPRETAATTRNAMVVMDTTRLAMAALLWRRDHDGRLPESLDALVPEYLDALPRDSRTGGPFTLFDLDGRLVVHSDRAEVADDHTRSLNRPNRPEDAIRWWAERSPKSSAAEVLLPPTDQ